MKNTPNIGLPQWELKDKYSQYQLNEAFVKIDTELGNIVTINDSLDKITETTNIANTVSSELDLKNTKAQELINKLSTVEVNTIKKFLNGWENGNEPVRYIINGNICILYGNIKKTSSTINMSCAFNLPIKPKYIVRSCAITSLVNELFVKVHIGSDGGVCIYMNDIDWDKLSIGNSVCLDGTSFIIGG